MTVTPVAANTLERVLPARLGDVLSQLYIASATLKRYAEDGAHAEDLPAHGEAVTARFEGDR